MKHSTIAILTGSKGSGKTYTQREIISLHPRIYALEPHGGEFNLRGAIEVRDTEELFDAAKTNWRRPAFLIVCVPDYDVQAASEEVARLTVSAVWKPIKLPTLRILG
jgi:hypothetical protein